LHAVIFGTGKWAHLLKIKLLSLNVSSIMVGDTDIADCSRKLFSETRYEYAKSLIFIASSTKNHFQDFLSSSIMDPTAIFVEKGFVTEDEKTAAKIWQPDIPKFILCQYRYSKVFDILESYKDNITRISYNWEVNNSSIEEWCPHIISIDNFIRNKNNSLYLTSPGYHKIDNVSNIKFKYGDNRHLRIYIETREEDIFIDLGTNNIIEIIRKKDKLTARSEFTKEDVLQLQLEDIITNLENTKLERL